MSDKNRDKIEKALLFIEAHIKTTDMTHPLSVDNIAHSAHLSSFHFQRLFRCYLGESVNQYIKNRRLEWAAYQLTSAPKRSLIDLAIDTGFETHSAFSQAFKKHFGHSPSQFRQSNKPPCIAQDPSRPFLKTYQGNSLDLNIELKTLPDLYFNYQRTKGNENGTFHKQSLNRVAADFAELYTINTPETFAFASAFPSSPKSLNDAEAEVFYGAMYLERYQSSWSDYWLNIAGGLWARCEHRGDYEYLYQSWSYFYHVWLPASNYELRDTLPFERYLTSPIHTAKKDWLTHIYVPISQKQVSTQ